MGLPAKHARDRFACVPIRRRFTAFDPLNRLDRDMSLERQPLAAEPQLLPGRCDRMWRVGWGGCIVQGMSGHLLDILSTPAGQTQAVRAKSLQRADILATFERQMAEYMQAAGERIRVAREAKFPTRAKAQDETGISEKQWYRWEHGVTEPTASNWEKIAQVLDIDLATLRADPPKMLDPESEYQAQLDRMERVLTLIATAVGVSPAEMAAQAAEDAARETAAKRNASAGTRGAKKKRPANG